VAAPEVAVPGLILVFSGAEPHLAAAALGREPLTLGRDDVLGLKLGDSRLSRRHAQLRFDRGLFHVRDLESRNGTFVDGERVSCERQVPAGTLRLGDTLLLLREDVRPFLAGTLERVDGAVIGPTLRAAWRTIAAVAAEGGCIHVSGETGTGKELAAHHFHDSTGRKSGPMVAVNCSALSPALAERLLFGTRKGAYSGAETDAIGYVQAASGGTLFLDEVAELDLSVQAKLLRVLEQREVLPLGATRPVAVDLRVCSATHRNLGDEVARGRFREDLYYRLGLPEVHIPPLRARREELPYLMQAIVGRAPGGLGCHASLVEAVLLRAWPGNVRELEKRLVEASRVARAQGDPCVRAVHLGEAGLVPEQESRPLESTTGVIAEPAQQDRPPRRLRTGPASERALIVRALEDAAGNQTRAAEALGISRRTLVTRLGKHKIKRPLRG
jgi:transcriptional regulator with PAS, ATPase and Fis domain